MIAEVVSKLLDMIQPPTPPSVPKDRKGNEYVIVKDGYTVHDLQPPSTSRRMHTFTDLRSFAEWLLRHAKPEATEISVGEFEVMAVLNGKQVNPDRITCDLVKHPTFYNWETALTGGWMNQVAFHQLVRMSRDVLGSDGEDLMLNLSQMKAVSGGEVEVHIDATGYTKFSGKKNTVDVEGKVPAEISVVLPVYDGVEAMSEEPDMDGTRSLETYLLEVLVQMHYEEGFAFNLVAPGLDLVMRAARRDAKKFLDSLLETTTGDKFLVGMGTLKGHEVKRIEK